MSPYWQIVIRPLLDALGVRAVIEIGAAAGRMTVKLLEFAAERSAVVHVIDPAPAFDVADMTQRYGTYLRLHEARSHDVLHQIGPVDAILIDGDHNWFTVYGELTIIESITATSGAPFPLIALHDVEWPYARRDLYYDPSAIPDESRHRWSRDGIVWGEIQLDARRGINHGLANACYEGTARNGVLTAVEDFMEQSALQLRFRTLPGYNGLGLLMSSALLDTTPALQRVWADLDTPQFLEAHARRLAARAAELEVAAIEADRRLRDLSNSLDVALAELQRRQAARESE